MAEQLVYTRAEFPTGLRCGGCLVEFAEGEHYHRQLKSMGTLDDLEIFGGDPDEPLALSVLVCFDCAFGR